MRVIIYEKQTGVGGTWYGAANYPDAACDVPSHAYSLSFARKPDWTYHFSRQGEIQSYLAKVAQDFGVTPMIRFKRNVVECTWQTVTKTWSVTTVDVETGARETVSARYLIAGNAPLCEPAYPNIPGRESFTGEQLHSGRWPKGGFDPRGKRIAVIGTGASAAQFVPQLAPQAAHLSVFQRTPAWVAPRWDFAYPRIFKFLLSWVPGLSLLYRLLLLLYHDMRYYGFIRPIWGLSWLNKKLVLLHLRAQVKDPVKRAALTPDYDLGCKRVILSDNFYPAMDKPNVAVVRGGATRITPLGVVGADGVEREVDAIVYGTGFDIEASVKLTRIVGKSGKDLKDVWDSKSGPEAYLGITVPDYPNLFFTMGPNTGLGHSSVVTMIEAQVEYAVAAIKAARNKGAATVEVKEDVCVKYNKQLQKDLVGAVWGGCKSWYNLQGTKNVTMWPWTVSAYLWACRSVKSEDYEFA
jgi:cation diffusion facilitator CzcD-associated flavoprotein CzcO